MLNRGGYWPGNGKKQNPARYMRQRNEGELDQYMSNGRKAGAGLVLLYMRRYILPLLGLIVIASFVSGSASINWFLAFGLLLAVLIVILITVWVLGSLGGIVAYFLSKIL